MKILNLDVIVSLWFVDQELAFALACTLSFDRIGLVIAGFVLPYLYRVGGLFLPLFAVGVLTIICWICGIFLSAIDSKAE
jgi:hypothetical protein